jgi:hypothetical protein
MANPFARKEFFLRQRLPKSIAAGWPSRSKRLEAAEITGQFAQCPHGVCDRRDLLRRDRWRYLLIYRASGLGHAHTPALIFGYSALE